VKLTTHEAIWEHAFKLVDSLERHIKAHIRAYLPFSCYMSEEDFQQMAYEAAYAAITTFLEKNTKKTKNKELESISECENIITAYFLITYRRMCSDITENDNDIEYVDFQETDINNVADNRLMKIDKNEYCKEDDYDKIIQKALNSMSKKQREIWKYMLSEGNVTTNKMGKKFNSSRQNISKLINRGLKRAAKLSAQHSKKNNRVKRA
jgi:hypothetical protein